MVPSIFPRAEARWQKTVLPGCPGGRLRGYAIIMESVLYPRLVPTSHRDRVYMYAHRLLERA